LSPSSRASFARDNVRRGEVKLLEIEDLAVWRELGLIYRKDRSLPQRRRLFWRWRRKNCLRTDNLNHTVFERRKSKCQIQERAERSSTMYKTISDE